MSSKNQPGKRKRQDPVPKASTSKAPINNNAVAATNDDDDNADLEEDLGLAFRSDGESDDGQGGMMMMRGGERIDYAEPFDEDSEVEAGWDDGDGDNRIVELEDEDDDDGDADYGSRPKKRRKPPIRKRQQDVQQQPPGGTGTGGLKIKLKMPTMGKGKGPAAAALGLGQDDDSILEVPQSQTSTSRTSGNIRQTQFHRRKNDILASLIPQSNDFTSLNLKQDHASRPLYISPNTGSIILEAFHPLSIQAQDFLIAISEPISRPSHLHEYKLTQYSLYAAVSVGLLPSDIIEALNRLSKIQVPKSVEDFIRNSTISYGKCKLVLKKNTYWVESSDPDVLRMLLRDEVVGQARAKKEGEEQEGLESEKVRREKEIMIPGGTLGKEKENENEKGKGKEKEKEKEGEKGRSDADLFNAVVGIDREDEMDEDDAVHSFEIQESSIESVKRRCNELDYPMLEEYDFRNDTVNPNLDVDLKPSTSIRPYQEKSLQKMFGNGRARSGIIVLPCGAGKTLVGITAACTIKKSCLILCTSGVSVIQWKQEFMRWSNIQDKQVAVFTADQKEKLQGNSGVVVSTYSMVANRQKRSHDAQKMMDFLTSREWGLILLDEVHVVPAQMFRKVVSTIKAHAKLGLTATLVREDDKIDDLNFLIGPKLFEANWMDLAQKGHIANVQCAEVWCDMTPEFYREYLREKSRKRLLLYCMNPRKFQACQFLIKYHEDRGDKIIVFSDNVYALRAYAKKLNKGYIDGSTGQVERMRILQHFQGNPLVNTIFLSKVGDTSIDLPEATCLIQISSHFGSRRQEAQRLGRILRAKRRNDEGFNAFFYSLVSRDTQEMYYSTKRQQFLIDQGYAFKIITRLPGLESMPGLVYPTRNEQIELLQSVLLAKEKDAELAGDLKGDNKDGDGKKGGKGGWGKAKRIVGNMETLSGAQSMSYVERNRSVNANLAREQGRHKLFQKRSQMAKDRKKDASKR